MDKELQNLLDNYENAIYGQAFPIIPSIHQLHLLLDYIANLEQQCKKQQEVIDKAIKLIKYHERYRDGADCCQFVDIVSEILDPLQSILEQDETTNNAYLKEFEDWLKEVSE